MKIPPVVSVTWVDAQHSAGEWTPIVSKDELPLIHTAGYLIHRTKKRLVVASAVDLEGGFIAGEITIPRGMVRSFVKLT